MAPTILAERDGFCLTVTLNRAEKANALSLEMLRALIETLQEAATDETLRTVVITGAGERVFSAGADLSELKTDRDDPSHQLWDNLSAALARLPIFSLALLNGPCIGGGLTLALGCDIRIGVPETRFQYPVLKNGVLPTRADVNRLRGLIGPGRMSSILLGGQSVDGETALAWGLLDRIVTRPELHDAALAMTQTACAVPRERVIEMKQFCREG